MLVVLAEARFDPNQMNEVRSVARPMIEASRAEPGCEHHCRTRRDVHAALRLPGICRTARGK